MPSATDGPRMGGMSRHVGTPTLFAPILVILPSREEREPEQAAR